VSGGWSARRQVPAWRSKRRSLFWKPPVAHLSAQLGPAGRRRACAADLGAATETDKVLCDAACLERVGGLPEQVTASGLRFRDIVVGKGPSPPTGYQVVVAYVAMTPGGKVFDSSLTRGAPYDVRVGAGQARARPRGLPIPTPVPLGPCFWAPGGPAALHPGPRKRLGSGDAEGAHAPAHTAAWLGGRPGRLCVVRCGARGAQGHGLVSRLARRQDVRAHARPCIT